jgi:DNA-binding transcriptional ArsR family regulator
MRHQGAPCIRLAEWSPSPSWAVCITRMLEYDFREGEEAAHVSGILAIDTPPFEYILSLMVNYSPTTLDKTFAALADPTRRAMLARLSKHDSISVSELAAPFDMSLPAVMKHLDVLSDAGLVKREKTGRVVACAMRAEPMREATEWLGRYQKFWSERFDRLATLLEYDSWTTRSPSQALPSRGAFNAPPEKVFADGPAKAEALDGPGRNCGRGCGYGPSRWNANRWSRSHSRKMAKAPL